MPKILIVRGDLASHSGYSKALRAITAMMAPAFDLVAGVDPHYSPLRSIVEFPFHRIHDGQAAELIERAKPGRAVVLHLTTPDGFAPLEGAYHIGYFFWETNCFRPDLMWPQAIGSMHEMWAPNHFVEGLIRQAGFTGPVRIVTWPHDLDETAAPAAPDLPVHLLAAGENAAPTLCRTTDLRARHETVFLGISTDVPRKGLPILISEWLDYRGAAGSSPLLLLKLASINVTKPPAALLGEVATMIANLCPRGLKQPSVGVILKSLSEDELAGLYAMADAFVTATMGEGFGGPIVECLRYNRPFLSPRHTSLAELIAPGYPFIVDTEAAPVILRDNVPVYSLASEWHIAKRGSLRDALARFESTPPEERTAIARAAREHARRFCGREVVEPVVSALVAELAGRLQAL